ncbi:helix-turn-helix transcriptional regulator [Cohnella cholangitidis]|uniref:helix-turn-helix transcriptional regulator n=1 Tax=Cohnella cholangitidis TaxID=2598458 RepID=UPI0015F8A6E1|nr:helix-turn-helix domain-containing protein [Cohnella cholangitidis]
MLARASRRDVHDLFFVDLKYEKQLMFTKRIDYDVEHELHMHDWLEINVLLENRARFRLLNRDVTGEAGDVFVFRPYEPHYNLVQEPGKPIVWILVLFSPSIVKWIPHGHKLLYPFYTDTVSPHIEKSSPYASAIHRAAIEAYEEEQRKAPGWETQQFMHFIDILIQIYRYTLDRQAEMGNTAVDSEMIAVLEHLLQHMTEEMDIQVLIRLYGKGKTRFYNDFRSLMGVSPNRFIHRLRVQIAMHLLDTTDKPITSIGFECGYNSIHYFNKVFKEHRGISPSQYRSRKESGML